MFRCSERVGARYENQTMRHAAACCSSYDMFLGLELLSLPFILGTRLEMILAQFLLQSHNSMLSQQSYYCRLVPRLFPHFTDPKCTVSKKMLGGAGEQSYFPS